MEGESYKKNYYYKKTLGFNFVIFMLILPTVWFRLVVFSNDESNRLFLGD